MALPFKSSEKESSGTKMLGKMTLPRCVIL